MNAEVCTICQDNIHADEAITYLHMNSTNGHHAFHKNCAAQWLAQGGTCPTCRAHAGTPPSDLQQDTLFYGLGAAPAGIAAVAAHGGGRGRGRGGGGRGRGPMRRACGHRACHNRLSAADSARRNFKYCGYCRHRGRGPY